MATRAALCVCLALLAATATADLYMHYPPGSNDRNRERNDNRNNGDRLFDSQNNGKGGYPWRGNAVLRAYPDPLTYYTGSVLRIEWTNQHSCGANPNVVCDIIVQYGCDTITDNLRTPNMTSARQFPGIRDGYPDSATEEASDNNNAGYVKRRFSGEAGQNNDGTNTIPDGQFSNNATRAAEFYIQGLYGGVEFGLHESHIQYNTCKNTARNGGLYTADQKLALNDARATRQNPNGARRGLECPEERDYYPYWNNKINRWADVAVLTNDLAKCDYFKTMSANVKAYGWCEGSTLNPQPIDSQQCSAKGGRWVAGTPNRLDGNGNAVPPDCLLHPLTRDNHLGNVAPVASERSGDGTTLAADTFQPETAHYLWTIPDELANKRCVVRLRYNMSTMDYPSNKYAYLATPYDIGINSSLNCERVTTTSDSSNVEINGQSVDGNVQCTDLITRFTRPLNNRPYVNVFGNGTSKLSIALNTNQAGRAFQDRSYVFDVRPAPVSGKIWNLNVRGRRGNIVQAYPAVEYDFVPSRMVVKQGEYVHIQFHGSDFNEAKAPNNGEGWQYSDRFNMVEMELSSQNFPIYKDKIRLFNSIDVAQRWALLDQENCNNTFKNGDANEQNSIQNCGKLNAAPARYPPDPFDGLMHIADDPVSEGGSLSVAPGTYYYVSTRNNNFSNRSQKGMIVVEPADPQGLTAGQKAGIAIGSIAGAGLIVGGLAFYGKKHPNTKVGEAVKKVSACQCRPAGASTTSAPDMKYTRGTSGMA